MLDAEFSNMLPALIIIAFVFTQSALSQEAPEEISDVEVTDDTAMESHGEMMMMIARPDDAGQFQGGDMPMEMMGSAPMRLHRPNGPFNQHAETPGRPHPGMSSKEQFCMAQMSACLASSNPNQGGQEPLQEYSQPNEGASETQESVVDAPPGGDPGSFMPFASGVNMGKINKVKRPPYSMNLEVAEEAPSTMRCNSQNFIGMHGCCSNTPGEFIKGAVAYACMDIFPINPGLVLREYNLNLGQLNDNSLDLSRSDTMSGEILGNGVCFMDCIFKKRYLIKEDGSLNYPMVAHHFMAAELDGAWHQVVMQAIRNCSQVMHKFPPKMENPESNYQPFCFTHPYLFQQCIIKTLRLTCPAPNRRTNSVECVDKRRSLQACDIFQKRNPSPKF